VAKLGYVVTLCTVEREQWLRFGKILQIEQMNLLRSFHITVLKLINDWYRKQGTGMCSDCTPSWCPCWDKEQERRQAKLMDDTKKSGKIVNLQERDRRHVYQHPRW
jgi:hypothetical protein